VDPADPVLERVPSTEPIPSDPPSVQAEARKAKGKRKEDKSKTARHGEVLGSGVRIEKNERSMSLLLKFRGA
jgi:hypothetical protein